MNKDIIKAQTESIIRTSERLTNKALSYSQALEILANLYEFKDYNTFSAWLKENPDFSSILTTEIHNRKMSLFTIVKEKSKNYLNKPLSKKVIAAKVKNQDWNITETIAIDFYNLMGSDIDFFNDYAQEQILGENAYNLLLNENEVSVALTDITYVVVGHIKGNGYDAGQVLVEVNAVLEVM